MNGLIIEGWLILLHTSLGTGWSEFNCVFDGWSFDGVYSVQAWPACVCELDEISQQWGKPSLSEMTFLQAVTDPASSADSTLTNTHHSWICSHSPTLCRKVAECSEHKHKRKHRHIHKVILKAPAYNVQRRQKTDLRLRLTSNWASGCSTRVWVNTVLVWVCLDYFFSLFFFLVGIWLPYIHFPSLSLGLNRTTFSYSLIVQWSVRGRSGVSGGELVFPPEGFDSIS